MLSIRKGNVYRSSGAMSINGSLYTELPIGTELVFVRGGRNPRCLNLHLEAARPSHLPQSPIYQLNLPPEKPSPRFSKGAVVTVITPIEVGGETYSQGVYLKCVKGGRSSQFIVRRPSDNNLITVCLQDAYLQHLTEAPKRIDNAIQGLVNDISADYLASEETIALSGTITLPDGLQVAVECRGGGDPAKMYSLGRHGRQPEERLNQAINHALMDAGINPVDVFESDSLFANYLAQTYGMETYGEYARDFMDCLKRYSC